jgi:hypothetical protein
MRFNAEDRILVDRYLRGELSGSELQSFIDRLDSDPSFRQAVSFYNLLAESIQDAADLELKEKILGQIRYRKPTVPIGLKLIVTFLFITLAGIIFWNYIGTDSRTNHGRYFSFSFLKKKPEAREEKKAGTQRKTKTESSSPDSSSSEGPGASTMEEGISAVPEGSSTLETGLESSGVDSLSASNQGGENSDIVIRKDRLLTSSSITVLELSPEEGTSSEHPTASLSQTTAEKLNPSSGLVEDETRSTTAIETEFWISPVNYRGYRLVRNKLMLYGLEEPGAVKLLRFHGTLYLRYGPDLFRLSPAEDFTSYQRVKDSDIPHALKQ